MRPLRAWTQPLELDSAGRIVVDKETGRMSQELSHVLKVFLIDGQGDVREIYTTSFLLPQVVMNDIETLLLERRGP